MFFKISECVCVCVFDFFKVTRMMSFQKRYLLNINYKYVHMFCNKLFR